MIVLALRLHPRDGGVRMTRPEQDADINDRPDRMIPVSGEESQLQNTTEDVDEQETARARQHDKHDQSVSPPDDREV